MADVEVEGVGVVIASLNRISENVREAVIEEMDDVAEEILSDSRDLAPQLTGFMIRTADVFRDDREDQTFRAVFYTAPYAIFQHEGTFNPGPVTAAKSGAGRKFLQRAFDKKKAQFIKRVGRAAEFALRTTLR